MTKLDALNPLNITFGLDMLLFFDGHLVLSLLFPQVADYIIFVFLEEFSLSPRLPIHILHLRWCS